MPLIGASQTVRWSRTTLGQALMLAVVLSCGGCQWVDWLVGNEDVQLRSDHRWQRGALEPAVRGAESRVWVRVRETGVDSSKVRVLSSRVRQVLSERGWSVIEERLPDAVWLDLRIRYWGACPVHDRGASVFAKLVRAHDPGTLAEGETPQPVEIGARQMLTPGASLISRRLSNLMEYVLVLDLHLRQDAAHEQKRTLIVWARRVDLDQQEADIQISEQVQEALKRVFAGVAP